MQTFSQRKIRFADDRFCNPGIHPGDSHGTTKKVNAVGMAENNNGFKNKFETNLP